MVTHNNQNTTKKKILIGNWKMHKSFTQAREDFLKLCGLTSSFSKTLELAICAPTLYLSELVVHANHVKVFAQNCHWENEGALTGEISANMLCQLGVKGSLVGHSERRINFLENDKDCGLKTKKLLELGMHAVLCVGETLHERETGIAFTLVRNQLKKALASLQGVTTAQVSGGYPISQNLSRLVIAYEPVWAIGTGKVATRETIAEMHLFIRQCLKELIPSAALDIPLLYGGSVKETNIVEIMSILNVDGVLVGGASLNPMEFFKLCQKSASGG